MVGVQVAYKNTFNFMGPDTIAKHLGLGAFATINKIQVLVETKRLCAWVPFKRRGGRACTQYC